MKKLSQKEWIAVSAGLIVVIVIFYLFVPFRFFASLAQLSLEGDVSTTTLSERVTESGLSIQDVVIGEGGVAEKGDRLTVHYVGRLTDGTQFDSSVDRGTPFAFILGAGSVIVGWDEGLVGMREGGRRVLVIPPELGYGSRGTGNIPPNATLIFDVVLLDVEQQDPGL